MLSSIGASLMMTGRPSEASCIPQTFKVLNLVLRRATTKIPNVFVRSEVKWGG